MNPSSAYNLTNPSEISIKMDRLQSLEMTALECAALLGAVKVKDYKCPKCGEIHNDQDDGYKVGGIKFPQYFNESKGSTMDGNYHDWDELHKCENCGTEYWFRNGAY